MKIFMNKGFLLKGCLMIVMMMWLACEDDREITYPDSSAIIQEIADPYLQVVTGFIPFKPGTEKYGFTFNVLNGVKALESVKLYGSFRDATSGETSNEVLYGEYDVNSTLRTVIKDSLTYDDLKAGITVNGSALPDSDEDVVPGSGWSFRFEGVDEAGSTVELAGAINMVLSKYAGNYKVIESSYWRIGVDNGDWNGQIIFIGHVDDVTLSHNDWWGPLPWAGASFHFTIDPDDNSITVPVLTDDGIRNVTTDGYAINCTENKAKFKNVPCEGSNKIVDDEGGPGKHRIYLTYGYEITEGATGTREFYEVLEKVVN